MAALLGGMVEDPEQAPALLKDAAVMLLAPFEGIPEEGSIYGDAACSLEERVSKYEATLSERIAKARKGGSAAQATALEAMLLFVLDELGFERDTNEAGGGGTDGNAAVAAKMAVAMAADENDDLMRLRGGGKGSGGFDALNQLRDDPAVRRNVDSALRTTENLASGMRKALKPILRQPTTTDATIAGALVGFITGKILIGDPKLLAIGGACTFAYAHRWPEKTDPRILTVTRRCTELAHEARMHFTSGGS